MNIEDYVREITTAFNNGEQRYWVHGYRASDMRAVEELLRPEFPETTLTEYSNDPNACVFCAVHIAVDITEMERIAKKRHKLLVQGHSTALPI